MYEVRAYTTSDGRIPYEDWLRKPRDRQAKLAVVQRLRRLELGNFGDHESCRDGVWELRIDLGAGYRVYYAMEAKTIVLLLCGGDKSSQDADIRRACDFWKEEQGERDAKRRS